MEYNPISSPIPGPDDYILIGSEEIPEISSLEIPEISSRAIPDPAFHGWWQNLTKTNQFGFGTGSLTQDNDSYIFIDTTVNPVKITSLAGTPAQPRERTNLDGNVINNLYTSPNPDELVNTLVPTAIVAGNGRNASLKLQPLVSGQPRTLLASFIADANLMYSVYNRMPASLFQKIDNVPVPVRQFSGVSDPILPDVNNPVEIARYILDSMRFNQNEPNNVNFNDKDYRPSPVQDEIVDRLFSQGITIEVPIRRLRVSVPGQHYLLTGFSSDICTDIFTEGYSYVTGGSTVEISGFEGSYCHLNGKYVNGVSWLEEGAVPNPRKAHLDVSEKRQNLDTLLEAMNPKKEKSKCKTKNCKRCSHKRCCKLTPEKIAEDGTWVNVYDHFQLRADTSDASKYPRDNLGWAIFKGCPKVKVTHRFHPAMEYAEFRAAITAAFYMLYQVSQHCDFTMFAPVGSIYGYTTWKELQAAVKLPGTFVVQAPRTRTQQSLPSMFYNDVTRDARLAVTYNDPFKLDQFPTPSATPNTLGYYAFNIVMANYISNPKNLYFLIEGTLNTPPIFPTQVLPAGYKPIKPAANRAQFVGVIGNINTVNGQPVPTNPDPVYATLLGQAALPTAAQSATQLSTTANNYYFGQIKTGLSNKKIGYIRFVDANFQDPSLFMFTSLFSPANTSSLLTYSRESFRKVFSTVMRYFVTDLNCDSLIFDIRGNNGGQTWTNGAFLEFIGADRQFVDTRSGRKDTGNSPLLNLANAPYTSVNNAVSQTVDMSKNFLVSVSETLYGAECIFRGTAQNSKKVILLTDEGAASAGSDIQKYFLGAALDGNLGSFTVGKIIGDNDERLKGGASARGPVPVSKENNFLVGPTGLPVSPINFRTDLPTSIQRNIVTGIFANEQTDLVAPSQSPTLNGTSGSKALPNDWESIVYPDIGLTPFVNHSGLPLGNPDYNNRATWRDTWLEQAILEASN